MPLTMALPQFGEFDLSCFRAKFCTSAPFRAELKADILARWPGALYEFYGMWPSLLAIEVTPRRKNLCCASCATMPELPTP